MTWLFLASTVASGCGAADSAVDPGDLELRDLLGVAPEVAASWDRAARARAREVIARAAPRVGADAGEQTRLEQGADQRASIVAGMRIVDEQRRARDREPVVLAWVLAEDQQLEVVPVAAAVMEQSASAEAAAQSDPGALVFEGWEQAVSAGWDDLALRQPGLLSELARQAGHGDEPRPLPVIPAPQAPFAMIFVDAGPNSFAAVNPVLLAALEPPEGDDDGEGEAVAHAGSGSSASARLRSRDASRAPRSRDPGIVSSPAVSLASAGNPYSFYGSINECGAFQRQRCADCTAAGGCETVTREGESGLAECQALSADGDRGYYLFCINLALAIATVSECTTDAASQCTQAPGAGNQLSALALNSTFLDDAACAAALDGCLSDIFGEPSGDFPGPGNPDPPPPPRDTQPSCGDSSANCEFSPSFDCSTGSCDNSLSCGGCEGSSCEGCSTGGCEGCEGCEGDGCEGGGGGGGGGGGSGCDDGGGDGGCGGDGCEGSSCDSGSCDSGGCDSGGCDSGGCDSGGCSGGCDSGGCSGGSSCNSSCSVTRRRGQGQTALGVLWLLAPCVFLEYRRRRERRREPVGSVSEQGGLN